MTLLTEAERAEMVAALPGWDLQGETITKQFAFDGFLDSVAFVTRVAVLSEMADHHPDIDIRWNKVTLALTTHEAGGLTRRDTELAAAIEASIG